MKNNKPPNIDDLKNFGFVECGNWQLQNDGSLQPNINNNPKNVLYAFATKGVVGYIGITEGTLKGRLKNSYAKLVYEGIRKCLQDKQDVVILCHKPEPDDHIKYRDIKIDLLSGLEIPLQRKFKTQWTTKGHGGLKKIIQEVINEIIIMYHNGNVLFY